MTDRPPTALAAVLRGALDAARARAASAPFRRSAALAAVLVAACRGAAPTTGAAPRGGAPAGAPAPARPGWTLVWADEFDRDGAPDPARWSYDVGGHGWGNDELQYYTRDRRENARVEGGRLVVEARREPWEGRAFTSARLVTKGKGDWTYGRFEARAELPTGRGTWPAVWMLASQSAYGARFWPDNGEIDVMEHVGFAPDTVHATVHTRAYHHSVGTQRGARTHVPGARAGYHVYAVEWTPDSVLGYVDARPYFAFANERRTNPAADWRQWPFDRPFHLLLNVAVGGAWGGARGVDPLLARAAMEVDYVRVYRRAGG